MTSNISPPANMSVPTIDFKEIGAKIEVLVNKNKILKSDLEKLQVKFNYMMAETEMKIMDAHQQAQQEITTVKADAQDRITEIEANCFTLETQNKILEEKMARILKRLESLC